MTYIGNAYFDAKGLFHEGRVWLIMEAIANIFLNIIFGQIWGVTGVLIATILTIFVFNFVGRTFVLFKHYFMLSPRMFMRDHAFYFLTTTIVGIATYWITLKVGGEGVGGLLLRGTICVFFPNIVFYAINIDQQRWCW